MSFGDLFVYPEFLIPRILCWVLVALIGMMLTNVAAVYLGDAIVERVSLKLVRIVAATLFFLIGVWVALEAFFLQFH